MTHPGQIILNRAFPDAKSQQEMVLSLCDELRQHGTISPRDARLLITMETQVGLTDEQIGLIVDFASSLCNS